jgi:hypothetical protein
MVALGVESGPLPYETITLQPDLMPVIIPASELAPLTELQSTPEGDLAKLRQTVAEPKRRGLFGRK